MVNQTKSRKRKRRISPREKAAVATDLRWRFVRDIMNTKVEVGDLLPSVNDITRRYGVSLAVARDLYQRLKDEGYVESVKGTGVFLKNELTELMEDSNSSRKLNLGVVAFIQYENPYHIYTRANVVLQAFERKSVQRGGRTRLYNLHPGHNVTIDHMEQIKQECPDGLFFMPPYSKDADENIRRLMMLDIPLVAVYKTDRTHSVLFDDRQAGIDITRFLMDQGYDHIGFIQKGMDDFWAKARFEGVCQAFTERRKKIDRTLIFDVKNEPFSKGFSKELDVVLKHVPKSKRTAIICSGEPYAGDLLNAVSKRGWEIPGKFGIASIGDHWMTRHLDFTTVQMSDYDLGLTAYELIADIIENKPTDKIERLVACPLIVRKTTSAGEPNNT